MYKWEKRPHGYLCSQLKLTFVLDKPAPDPDLVRLILRRRPSPTLRGSHTTRDKCLTNFVVWQLFQPSAFLKASANIRTIYNTELNAQMLDRCRNHSSAPLAGKASQIFCNTTSNLIQEPTNGYGRAFYLPKLVP
jgi:hypothetical protein